MPTLINESFFVRDINIPNSRTNPVKEKLLSFIAKYEPQCLKEILGYNLYKAFLSETNTLLRRQAFGFDLRQDEQIRVGETIGLIANTNSFVFDGSNGTRDYRGYEIVVSEITGRGVLIKGVDYSWNYQTGVFTLLITNDKFQANQYYNIHFQNSPFYTYSGTDNGLVQTLRMTNLLYGKEYVNSYGITKNWDGLVHDTDQSLIAYYIYYYYQEESISLTTGKGTAKPIQESAETVSPAEKMINAWNCMSNEVSQLANFLWFNKSTYPEFENCDFTRVATNFRKNSLFGF